MPKPPSPAQNAKRLRACVLETETMLQAVRLYTGEPTNVTCRRLEPPLDPSLVRRCLGKRKGRQYTTTRRALEVGLALPPYLLDELLDGEDSNE